MFIGQEKASQNYLPYHNLVNEAETLIAVKDFNGALVLYEQLIRDYDFIFLRDIKVAAQLAYYLEKQETSLLFIRKGFQMGWELKKFKNEAFFKGLQKDVAWKELELEYEALHNQYLTRMDELTREKVHKMFKKDQKKAMGALLRIGDNAQTKYNETKFAPHSEEQMLEFLHILNHVGYPGEKLIGNDYWMSTVLIHHNSISQEYNKKDTLYISIKPVLKKAVEKGEMSPYEFALIEDWQIRTVQNDRQAGYGFLQQPRKSTLSDTDQLRKAIGMRSIGLRNALIEIEDETGMNFYLPDWVEGKIVVEEQ